jgi:ubiquinone/menaquinone biosynthesis C-methylase UbiE
MDVTDMVTIANNSFDIALDKSTIDALLCAPRAQVLVGKMLKEVQRILKPGGYYIAISYGEPDNRSYLFDFPFIHWEKREFALFDPEQDKKNKQENAEEESKSDKPSSKHYIYVGQKLEGADEISE